MPLPPLGEHELLVFWCQLSVLLLAARLGGGLARRLGQPRVIGELIAGVLLGPSVVGVAWPEGWRWLFPADDRQAGLLLGLSWFGIVLLLMTTGAETDLSAVRRQGRAAAAVAIGSLLVPLAAGGTVGALLPETFVGEDGRRWVFAAFVGIALAISSLPVAARILDDLGLLSRPIGQLVVAVAVTNDVVGWILLGVLVGFAETGSVSVGGLLVAVLGTAGVGIVVLGAGARLLDRTLDLVRPRNSGPAASASIAILFTVAVGALTQALGVEVVIGAFVAGIAIGQSRLGSDPMMHHVETLTAGVFAPLFFAVAGLRVDLRALDGLDVLIGAIIVTVVATAAKIGGSYLGARIGGLSRAEAFGVGSALNARGALEVVVATVGLVDRGAEQRVVRRSGADGDHHVGARRAAAPDRVHQRERLERASPRAWRRRIGGDPERTSGMTVPGGSIARRRHAVVTIDPAIRLPLTSTTRSTPGTSTSLSARRAVCFHPGAASTTTSSSVSRICRSWRTCASSSSLVISQSTRPINWSRFGVDPARSGQFAVERATPPRDAAPV